MTDLALANERPEPRPRWYQRSSWLLLVLVLTAAVIYSASSGAFDVGVRQTFHVIWDHLVSRLDDFAIGRFLDDLWDGFAALPVIGSIVGFLDDFTESFRGWLTPEYSPREDSVIWDIRVPRVFLGAAVGGLIALGATLIQAAFRNPLADPGLTGVSATGAWAALLMTFVPTWTLVDSALWTWSLKVIQPAAAAIACFLVLILLWLISRQQGSVESISFVLTGIAINAVAIAAIGLTNAFNGDVLQQATSFWATGGLSQATWYPVKATWAVLVIAWIATLWLGRTLNVFALGDREAEHLGINVSGLRLIVALIASILLGFAASYAGAIAFVGLIVPQFLRAWQGPDLRKLIPQSVLGGAITVVIADLVARTISDPVEVGIGLVLTIVGGPVFVLLMVQMRRRQGGWV
jgi:iron complex transport system permease protein